MNQHIFRTYDIRGIYGSDLTAEAAKRIAKGYISFLIRSQGTTNPRIIVSKDNRTHGPELQDAFIAGLMEHGAQVLRVEDATSPMLYFGLCDGDYDGGVSITASHNPAEYNGFKLLGKGAHSIAGEDIQAIKQIILDEDFVEGGEGKLEQVEIAEAYYNKITSIVSPGRTLKVVIDAANGIAGKYYPELFRRLGCEVVELYCEQDGTFPNHEADPVVEANTEDLKKKVVAEGADLGISFDGDGDRCAIIDERGVYHDANQSFVLLIKDLVPEHPGTTVIYTVSNSLIVPEAAQEAGGKAVMVPVGHSYVEHAMTEHQAVLGGEQSGHFFVAENYYPYDDAAYTATKLVEIFSKSDQKVSEHYAAIPEVFALEERRPHCADDQKFEVIKQITTELSQQYECETMDGVRIDFGDGAWLGIRASNTSPCLSICMEAKSEEKLAEIDQIAKETLKKHQVEL